MEERPVKEYSLDKLNELCQHALGNLSNSARDAGKTIEERRTVALQQLERAIWDYSGKREEVVVHPDIFDELTPLEREDADVKHFLQVEWGLRGDRVPRTIADYLEQAVPSKGC